MDKPPVEQVKQLIHEIRMLRKEIDGLRAHMGSGVQFLDDSVRDLARRVKQLTDAIE